MTGFARHGMAAVALTLGLALGADGFGGRLFSGNNSSSSPAVAYSYYPPIPVYSMPMSYLAMPSIPVAPYSCQPGIATPPPMPYAKTVVPVPKTSETQEPPPFKEAPRSKAPSVTESRSMGGSYAASADKDRCKVGFWNVSGKDVTLKVGDQAKTLAKDRVVTMEVGRSFVWQIDQREPTTENVPVEQAFYEVIIR